jgi:hypothetical protein
MPPETVPMVQEKWLEVVAVNSICVADSLQVSEVAAVVTAGIGFTVTVIAKGVPLHSPVTETGVTRYCTEPDEELLGLDRI